MNRYPEIPREILEQAVSLRQAGKMWTDVEKSLGFGRGAIRNQLIKAGLPHEFPAARTRVQLVTEQNCSWDMAKAGAMLKVSLRAAQ